MLSGRRFAGDGVAYEVADVENMGIPLARPRTLTGHTVLVRADLNVPMRDGKVTDRSRLEQVLPTVRQLRNAGARTLLLSHLGRPKGTPDPTLSLRTLLPVLEGMLDGPVTFLEEPLAQAAPDRIQALPADAVVLVENVRFHPGEEANDREYAKALARLGTWYINDAFSCAHRAHASTEALADLLPAAAGPLMRQELEALARVLEDPERPVAAMVGGAKVSTKISVIEHLLPRMDRLVIGGGMANTFLAAMGHDVGRSLYEPDAIDLANSIMEKAQTLNCNLLVPLDVVVATEFRAHAESHVVTVDKIPSDAMALDIGPRTIAHVSQMLTHCRTLLWNGPMGAFELRPFDIGTATLASFAAEATEQGTMVTVAGGGDTVAALNTADVAERLSHVSLAGGAFLEWLEGKTLPGIAALQRQMARAGTP